MALQVTAGKILRRGTDGLTPAQLKELLDNTDKVQGILDEIEARRKVFLDTEAVIKAGAKAVEKDRADLVAREGVVATERADLDAAIAAAAAKDKADTDALSRRTREMADKELASDGREEALGARAQEIEDHGRALENELRAREEVVEAQESAVEEREQSLMTQSSALDVEEKRIKTVAKQVKQAVAKLP